MIMMSGEDQKFRYDSETVAEQEDSTDSPNPVLRTAVFFLWFPILAPLNSFTVNKDFHLPILIAVLVFLPLPLLFLL